MKPITVLSLLTAAVALAACQSERAPRDLPVTQRPVARGVEGAWVDPNGIVSTFAAGTFTTRTTPSSTSSARSA